MGNKVGNEMESKQRKEGKTPSEMENEPKKPLGPFEGLFGRMISSASLELTFNIFKGYK